MHYIDFLRNLHGLLSPRTYLEIGVRNGDSLSLCRCPSIGIDPTYDIARELRDDAVLERRTSGEYFASLEHARPFGELPIDLAFIDGLHLFEYAVDDFTNVERFSDWSTVIVFDDIFPKNVDEAARVRHTQAWTGDVFKVPSFLETHRSDLLLLRLDTEPTGLLMVLCADPLRSWMPTALNAFRLGLAPDPQDVPIDVFARVGAQSPDSVLDWDVWRALAENRALMAPEEGRRLVRTAIARSKSV